MTVKYTETTKERYNKPIRWRKHTLLELRNLPFKILAEGGKDVPPHPSSPARGLGKRCKLPQWSPGRSPSGNLAIYNVL